MTSNPLDIAIIGAGPAGLAAALRLHQRGFRPRIYEAVQELKPLGVGIDVKVYGSKELDELGLLEEFRAISVDARESIFYNKYGQEIYAELCGVHMGYLYEQRFVHRGRLQMLLYRTVLERMGPDTVVPGVRCTGYTNHDDRVTLDLLAQDGTASQVTADLAVAADGINSALRRQMHPDHAEPVYSGITMWRGTTLMEPFGSGGTILHIGAPQSSSMIVYPIAEDFEDSGKVLVNWVVEATREESVEDWNQLGAVDEIMHYYDQCDIVHLDVQEMMRNAREVYLFPLIRHEPLDTWTDGRVLLIGDAAHAMYPRGGNGACQAIVDGGALADKLATIEDVPEALRAFEEKRLKAVNGIVMAHRGEGYEVIRRMVEERTGGERFTDVEEALPLAEADAIFSRYHALVGQPRPGHEAGDTTGFRTKNAYRNTRPRGVVDADDATRAEILAAEERRRAALLAVDIPALDDLFDASLVHTHAPGLTHDKAQLLEHVATRKAYLDISRGPLGIRLIGDVAVVTGRITNRLDSPDGTERVVQGQVIQVLRRCEDGAWRYVSFQMTPDGEHVWPATDAEKASMARTGTGTGRAAAGQKGAQA